MSSCRYAGLDDPGFDRMQQFDRSIHKHSALGWSYKLCKHQHAGGPEQIIQSIRCACDDAHDCLGNRVLRLRDGAAFRLRCPCAR